MIGVPTARRRNDHHTGAQSSQYLHQAAARLIGIADPTVGKSEILAHVQPHYPGSFSCLGGPQIG